MVIRLMEMPLAELLDKDMEAKYARLNEYLSNDLLPHIRKYWKTKKTLTAPDSKNISKIGKVLDQVKTEEAKLELAEEK